MWFTWQHKTCAVEGVKPNTNKSCTVNCADYMELESQVWGPILIRTHFNCTTRFALEVLVASRHRKYSSVSVHSTTQHFPKLTWKYRILSDSHVAHRIHSSLDRRENRCQIVHTLIIVSFCPKYTCISRTKTILSVLAVASQRTSLSLAHTYTAHNALTVNNTFNSWKFCARTMKTEHWWI